MNANLFALLSDNIADPAATAIETAAGERISYADLVARTGKMANALAGLGVKPGDRVAAQVEKSVEAIVLYLGTVRAGGVFLPLNTGYTPAEIEYFVGDAEPAVFVCDPGRREALQAAADKAGATLVTLDAKGKGTLTDAADAAPEAFATVERAADDLAALLYTSGTTGRSKGAMLTHGNLVSNAAALREAWAYTADDVLIHALPIFHTHGLFVATNVTLFSGASMIFLPKFDVDRIFELMPRATVLMGVPTFYVRLLEDEMLNAETTAHMRVFIAGSAPLLAETHREWQAKTGHAILERYGMTETNMNASNPYDGDRVAGTVGLPLPGVEIIVTDPETGAELAQGEVGMIEVRGPNVFKGYWRMPEKTAAELRENGFFITGDLGKIDEQRLRPHRRPRQGPDHHRRLQRLSEGNRDRDRRDPRRARVGGRRRAAPRLRRGGDRGGGPDRQGGAGGGRRAEGPRGSGSPSSSCRSACSSSTNCRATPWARCRRTCSATGSAISTAPDLPNRQQRSGARPTHSHSWDIEMRLAPEVHWLPGPRCR